MSYKSLIQLATILAASASASAFAKVNVVKVCNHRAEPIWVVYSKHEALGAGKFASPKSYGWFRFGPEQCMDLARNLDGYFSIYAKNQNGDWTSDDSFGFDTNIGRDWICVTNGAFKNVDSNTCVRDNAPGYREVYGHYFNFYYSPDYNVYEIDL